MGFVETGLRRRAEGRRGEGVEVTYPCRTCAEKVTQEKEDIGLGFRMLDTLCMHFFPLFPCIPLAYTHTIHNGVCCFVLHGVVLNVDADTPARG